MNTKWKSLIHRLRRDNRGIVAIVVGLGLTAIAGMVGVVTQETIIYRTQSALQSSANLAALAGAQSINNPTGTAISTATSYSAVTGGSNTISGQTVTFVSGYPLLKCLTSTGVSCGGTGTDQANAIVVKQQATVPLIFGKLFGKSSITLTATATAGAGGGGGGNTAARDIMIILDTTESMVTTSDPNCGISGANSEICAQAGIRALLLGLNPSADHVGLMIFPGLTTAAAAAEEYDCSSSTPPSSDIADYSASPVYQIVPLSSDYKTSSTATTLNTSSDLVIALAGGASGCTAGLTVWGGPGTYYAGIITAAETALTTTGRTGVQKAIVIVSDGGANSKYAPAGMTKNQCQEAITAAETATAAGTWVYSAAYGSSTATGSSSTCTTDSSGISACATMQQMASTPKMFFASSALESTCTSTMNASSTNLVTVLQALGTSLGSTPRLLPNTTT
jgi:Putative Tad-like Flp pilus-assembly